MLDDSRRADLAKHFGIVFSEYYPLAPESILKELAQQLYEVAKMNINIGVQEEHFVAIGYHGKDIVPHVTLERGLSILSFNLLAVEFLADILLFKDFQNSGACEYLCSKYLRILNAADGKTENSAFYNWIYSQSKDKSEYNYRHYLFDASAGGIFLFMHEWSHTQPYLIPKTKEILLSSSVLREYCEEQFRDKEGNRDYSLYEELCCDFNALAFCDRYSFAKHLCVSETEFLGTALIALLIPSLYSLFEKPSDSNELFAVSKVKDLKDALIKRVCALGYAIKLFQNSKMFFLNQDLQEALNYPQIAIQFLGYLAAYLENSFISRIESFNGLSEEEQKKYNNISPSSVWMLLG